MTGTETETRTGATIRRTLTRSRIRIATECGYTKNRSNTLAQVRGAPAGWMPAGALYASAHILPRLIKAAEKDHEVLSL